MWFIVETFVTEKSLWPDKSRHRFITSTQL